MNFADTTATTVREGTRARTKMRKKIKTIQEQYHTYFMMCLFFGSYPPGSDDYLKSKFARFFFRGLGYVFLLASAINIIGLAWYIIDKPPSNLVILIALIRRDLITFFMVMRLALHLLRYKQTDELFKRWNEDLNTTYMADERMEQLPRDIKSSVKTTLIGLSVRFTMSVLYSVPLLRNRYMRSSELAGLPHDNSAPDHFYYVAYQIMLFNWIAVAVPPVEFYILFLYTMAENEMDLLRDKLAKILGTLDISEENELIYNAPTGPKVIQFGDSEYREATQYVDEELKQWAKIHIETLEWIGDFGSYLSPDTSLKYMYLGIHCSLVVIGLTGMNGAAMINDLALTLTVSFGTFWVLFHITRKADRLEEQGNEIFIDAYARCWFLYPNKTQKFVKLISRGVVNTSISFPSLKIYADNSENMKEVLNMAYQALSFILPMTTGNSS